MSRPNGIGFAVAQRLGSMGARLFLHGWSPDNARYFSGESGAAQCVDALRADGIDVRYMEADFMDSVAPEAVVQAAVDAYGHVDILDANHAYSFDDRLETLKATELDKHLLINVRGSLLLAKAFAAQHDGRAGGRIIMMTSGQHLGSSPNMLSYMASKGAIAQVTHTLSATLVSRGVTVNAVNPGPTDTGWADEDVLRSVAERMPHGWGKPDDAARVIAWLCTDDARWVTGQVINSEGGFRHAWE